MRLHLIVREVVPVAVLVDGQPKKIHRVDLMLVPLEMTIEGTTIKLDDERASREPVQDARISLVLDDSETIEPGAELVLDFTPETLPSVYELAKTERARLEAEAAAAAAKRASEEESARARMPPPWLAAASIVWSSDNHDKPAGTPQRSRGEALSGLGVLELGAPRETWQAPDNGPGYSLHDPVHAGPDGDRFRVIAARELARESLLVTPAGDA